MPFKCLLKQILRNTELHSRQLTPNGFTALYAPSEAEQLMHSYMVVRVGQNCIVCNQLSEKLSTIFVCHFAILQLLLRHNI